MDEHLLNNYFKKQIKEEKIIIFDFSGWEVIAHTNKGNQYYFDEDILMWVKQTKTN